MLIKCFRDVGNGINHKNLLKQRCFFSQFRAITIMCSQHPVDFAYPTELFGHSNVEQLVPFSYFDASDWFDSIFFALFFEFIDSGNGINIC